MQNKINRRTLFKLSAFAPFVGVLPRDFPAHVEPLAPLPEPAQAEPISEPVPWPDVEVGTPGASSVQMGFAHVSSVAHVVFPVAFSRRPFVFLSSCDDSDVRITSLGVTGFTAVVEGAASARIYWNAMEVG